MFVWLKQFYAFQAASRQVAYLLLHFIGFLRKYLASSLAAPPPSTNIYIYIYIYMFSARQQLLVLIPPATALIIAQ